MTAMFSYMQKVYFTVMGVLQATDDMKMYNRLPRLPRAHAVLVKCNIKQTASLLQ